MDDLERQLRALADHRASLVPGTHPVPGTTEAVPGTGKRFPRRWLAAAAVLVVGLVAGGIALGGRDEQPTPLTTESPTTRVSDTMERTTFVSQRWGLTFDAPSTWASGPDVDRWTGPDGGHLTIAAHDAVGTVDEIAAKIALLAGDAPIEQTAVDGQPARLIRPDTLVVELPAPRLGMSTLVITIDAGHLDQITSSLRWLEEPEIGSCADDAAGPGPLSTSTVTARRRRSSMSAAPPPGRSRFGAVERAASPSTSSSCMPRVGSPAPSGVSPR